MPKVKINEPVTVVVRPGLHLVYRPGEQTAPDAHIDDIVRQGKGERLGKRGDALRDAVASVAAAPSAADR